MIVMSLHHLARKWRTKPIFPLKNQDISYFLPMRFACLGFMLLFGVSEVHAQIQLIPPSTLSAPVKKPPRAFKEPDTKGDFPHRLAQKDLQVLFFNGQPIEARGLGGVEFQVTYFSNGQAERLSRKSNEKVKGKWRLQGDGYCSHWEGESEICYTIVQDGDIYKVVRGTRSVAIWSASQPSAPQAPVPAK